MRILAPINTFESTQELISAGAQEIYTGGDDPIFKSYSFSGRGKLGHDGVKVANNADELKKIVDYAHDHNVTVNFTANTQFFSNFMYCGKTLETHYLEYVKQAVAAGVDSIIVGDIGLLHFLRKQQLGVPLHGSVFLKTINKEQILFLRECGVNRVTLSYHITMEEIEKFVEEKIMEYEVIGYMGCSFFNGACGLLHEYGEGVIDSFSPGVSCKGVYRLNDEGNEEARLFDVEAACAACKMRHLDDLGIDALKIVGRERNCKATAEVVSLYRKILANGETPVSEIVPSWWKRVFCKNNSCKYSERNNSFQYVIGGDVDEN